MEDKLKVLVVDDDDSIRELIQIYLEDDFNIINAVTGNDAVVLAENEKPALIILDIMLPKKSGWDVCKEIRKFSNVPIIIVTAKGEEFDRILGLEIGADDYICKPFSPRELLARVKAQIRRNTFLANSNQITNNIIEVNYSGLVINYEKYKVMINNVNIELTTNEFQLIAFMARHQGQVFSREQLLQNVWGFDFEGDSRAVDSAVKRLRKKFKSLNYKAEIIHSIRGIGYKFEVENI